MRVVLVVPTFPQLSETFIVSKLLGLLARGVDAHVVTSRIDEEAMPLFPDLRPAIVRDRVHAHTPLLPLSAAAARALVLLTSPPRVVKAVQTRSLRGSVLGAHAVASLAAMQPDLVHFEFGTSAIGRCGLLKSRGIPSVVSFRGFDLNLSGLEDPHYYDDVWQHATAFHFLGFDLRKRALDRGCPPDRMYRLIPPALNVETFGKSCREAAVPTEARPLHLLSVGRLHWKKGYEWMLDATRLVQARFPVVHRVAGDGPHRLAVEFARHQLGVDSSVQILGPVAPAAVADLLSWADIFVHAAVSEGFCNAVIEAQAAGLAVVTSDADGLAENIEHGVTGVVVPRRDPEAMADAICSLAADPERRLRMGAAGRDRVRRLFDIQDQVDSFVDLYVNVAG